ncbi:hypothetical protein QR98_0080750 [Sarcoptes scabiei]|uniref:Uncharacterized protein n=1 Tax=Sarcoptes scabiei TaxID=52283 RepID=A0A132AEW9_SARSC|nr:hypothetical protein QR98_0080750 [Sarcoptes scabiei]
MNPGRPVATAPARAPGMAVSAPTRCASGLAAPSSAPRPAVHGAASPVPATNPGRNAATGISRAGTAALTASMMLGATNSLMTTSILADEAGRVPGEHVRRRSQTISRTLPAGALTWGKRVISARGPVGHLRRPQRVSDRLLSIRECSAADNIPNRCSGGLDGLVDVVAGGRLKRGHDIGDDTRV